MQYLDISWGTILKIIIGGALTYLLFPALLACRDLLLHKVIDKWIVTDFLKAKIAKCSYESWLLENQYNLQYRANHNNNTSEYFIGEQQVNKDEYNEYRSAKQEHQNEYNMLFQQIAFKHNMIEWLLHHYKQIPGSNPIPSLLDESYKQHCNNRVRS